VVIETERLLLRKMREEDVDHLLAIFSDPVAMKYYPSTKTREQTIEWIQWTNQNYKSYGVGLWIVEKKNSHEFLGQCGIVPQKIDGKVEMEIGYSFIRQHWGNGYATESAKACCEYGFHELGYSRLISLIIPQNKSSIAVAERAGMKKEKEIRKWDKHVYVYSITNEGSDN
jgi:RimJ/RimL family protein N-acetyltransferase